jgi:hypothetical protein
LGVEPGWREGAGWRGELGWRDGEGWREALVGTGDAVEVRTADVWRRSSRRERAIERLCLTLRRVAEAAAVARAGDWRVARPSRSTAVSANRKTSAAASGCSVRPETSASTSWLPFSDQIHSR